MEPEDSLIMRYEDLRTIPEKESDKFIKSNIEDLVLIPKESEDMCDSDSEYYLPFCNDFMILSNPLFNVSDDFTSSNDESRPEEDVQEKNFKIYSNPLFEFDVKYISSDVNPFFNKVLEGIENKEPYVSNLDEPALLVTPLSDANEDECFDPGCDINKINAFLELDDSMDIKDGYHDLEGDIIYLESLLINDTIPNLPPKVFLNHDPKFLKDEPDNNDLKSMIKVFDPGIWEKFFSPTYVKLPFEDRHYLSVTYVIRIFLPYLTYSMDSSLPFSSRSEDTIFDPGISAFHFSFLQPVVSHRSGTFMCFNVYLNILTESLMDIYSSACFNPNIMMIWEIPYGESKVHIKVLSVLWENRLPIQTVRDRCLATDLSTLTPEPSRCFNFCYDDDDDGESTIPLNETISQLPSSIAITLVLLTMVPEDFLIMRDEDLRTIPKKESDEFIKSSVEDLVPILRESEDTSDTDSECDLPFCNDFVIFSNPLFNVNDDFTSSNDESRLEEDV
nr:hypothetical protein [Tanacetum cinerariifolium]